VAAGVAHMLGVSKKTGESGTGTEKPGSRFRFRFGKTKNRVPRFRYPVFTGLPGTGLNIYIFFLVRALHFSFLVCLHTCFYFLLF
jgi:hypothetical protein